MDDLLQLWTTLADHHLQEMNINWDKVRKVAFNDQLNPEDDRIGLQIVKVRNYIYKFKDP